MLQLTHKNLFKTLKDLLPGNPTIVEAGSFTGKDTIRLAQQWPEGTVHSFEPDPAIFDQLNANTRGYSNIRTYQLALSDQNGTASFWPSQHPKKPNTPSQAGSLLQPKERLKWSNIPFKDPIEISTITLSSWAKKHNINQIDLLWLDLQGYELPVMQASGKLIKQVPFIYTEVHFVEAYADQAQYPELKEWLESQDFTIIGKDFNDNPTWFFGNVLCAQKDRLSCNFEVQPRIFKELS